MAATMKDIARRTGLGLATISSYFNGGNVREKNRIKIEEAIQELHYEVNEVARGLKTNATKTIGVVIPELNNTFCAEIITGMEDVLRSHGYETGAGCSGVFKPEACGRDHQHASGCGRQSSEKIPENRKAHRTH